MLQTASAPFDIMGERKDKIKNKNRRRDMRVSCSSHNPGMRVCMLVHPPPCLITKYSWIARPYLS